MKIQIIGLPGAGKTTAIHQYISHARDQLGKDVLLLDIRNYQGICRDRQLRFDLMTKPGIVIAESACGVACPSVVIKLDTQLETALARSNARGETTTRAYFERLQGNTIKAHHIVESPKELQELLRQLLEGQDASTNRHRSG